MNNQNQPNPIKITNKQLRQLIKAEVSTDLVPDSMELYDFRPKPGDEGKLHIFMKKIEARKAKTKEGQILVALSDLHSHCNDLLKVITQYNSEISTKNPPIHG